MKNEYNDYLKVVDKIGVRKLASAGKVSEDLIRKYKNGQVYPKLITAVLIEKEFNIPCEFWIVNKERLSN